MEEGSPEAGQGGGGSSRRLGWEYLVTAGAEGDAALPGGRVAYGQLDLDALALAADLQLDAAAARYATAGSNRAGDATAAAVEQLDFLRTEIEDCLAVG